VQLLRSVRAVNAVLSGHDRRCQAVSWAIWITGLPGSGKSTITQQVVAALQGWGERVAVLEARAFAAALVPDRAPSPHELDLIYRGLVHTASVLTQAGVPVIVDATAHRRAWRDLARETIADFAEVQLTCPEAICGAREQAVRWRGVPRIGQGTAAPSEPAVVLDYEYSLRAELTINTEAQHVWTSVADVLLLVERLRRSARRTSDAEDPPNGSAIS
jgi:adenylylsulfate kinase